MPITFDPNSPIPDEFDPNAGQPQKPQSTPQASQQPKPSQPKPTSNQQYGPGTSVNLQGVAKWVEENVGIPAVDLIDNVFQGNQKTPDQIARERADARTRAVESQRAFQDMSRKDPAAEIIRGVAGGAADLVTGVVNLPTQVVQGVTGKPWYTPVNQGLINENNTTAGQALRTLSRYAWGSLIPVPGMGGATGLGLKAAGQRAAEGFVQDFAAGAGDGSDTTFIGSIPGLKGLQTNEAYNPIANRALIGLEGALFNAGFGAGAEAVQRVAKWWKAGRPAAQAEAIQQDINLINSVGPTMKYGGSPNELVVDGLKSATQPVSGFPTVPFTAPSIRPVSQAASTTASQAPINFKPVDMSSKNIQSISFENANGQPGFDLWFADKRFPALLPGTVKKIGQQGSRGRGYGNYVVIESIDPKTGEKVDVLYGHLADGGIKVKEGDQVVPGMEIGTQGGTGRVVSSDGTIASVDFLAPAAKESKSMKPYKRFQELRRELADQIGKGGIKPGQAAEILADAAKALPGNQADQTIQETSQQLELLTRKQALDNGYEVHELVPVAARNDVNDVAAEMIKNGPDLSVENTAKPAVFSLTDNEIRAIAGSSDEALNWANNLAKTVDYEKIKALAGTDNIDIEKIRSNVREQFAKDILEMSDDEFGNFVKQITVTDKQGRTTVTDEGIFALTFKLNELASQSTDLAKAAINADINGQNPQLAYLRAVDRGMALMQLEKVANNADSWNLSRRGALRNEDQVLTDAAQKQIEQNQQKQALIDTRLSLMKEARDAIIRGDEAWLEKFPAAMRALAMVGANPKAQLNVWRTLSQAIRKTGDTAFTGSVLSGPGTSSVNLHGILFNGLGRPLIAYLNRVLPGAENKQVREEAVAAISGTISAIKDINDLIPKIWNATGNIDPKDLGREFVGLDEATSRNLARVKQKLDSGELSPLQAGVYNFATALHDIVNSPLWTGTIRRTLGSIDTLGDVVAGRQAAYTRAWLDARAILGDQPSTSAYSKKFSELLESQRNQHLKSIFDEDGITLIDPEAKKLADIISFRMGPDDFSSDSAFDKATRSMIQFSEIPGMKMLGITFVRSPAVMMKAATRFTPGLSNIIRKFDKVYKEGTPYERAVIDGANALGWFLGVSSYINGYLGVQTGAGPTRGKERDSWSESHDPFRINLPGDAQFNYQWLEPLSTPMGFFADLGYYTRYGVEKGLEDNFARGLVYTMSKILDSGFSNVVNKSYFTQLSTISQLTNVSSFKKVGENIASGIVPWSGMRNQVGAAIDPLYRELRSELTNTFEWFIQKRGGLGLSRFAPEDLDDVTGKPLYRNGVDGDVQSSLLQAFNLFRPLGVTVSKDRFKPVHKYLTEVGINVSDTRDKILGTPLTNDERTEFTRFMTKGGKFEKELLRYFKSDEYRRDKVESNLQLQQGMKPSETDSYQKVSAIINNYARLAMYEMGKGLTPISQGFMARRSQQLNEARQQGFDRQQQALQQLREYPLQ